MDSVSQQPEASKVLSLEPFVRSSHGKGIGWVKFIHKSLVSNCQRQTNCFLAFLFVFRHQKTWITIGSAKLIWCAIAVVVWAWSARRAPVCWAFSGASLRINLTHHTSRNYATPKWWFGRKMIFAFDWMILAFHLSILQEGWGSEDRERRNEGRLRQQQRQVGEEEKEWRLTASATKSKRRAWQLYFKSFARISLWLNRLSQLSIETCVQYQKRNITKVSSSRKRFLEPSAWSFIVPPTMLDFFLARYCRPVRDFGDCYGLSNPSHPHALSPARRQYTVRWLSSFFPDYILLFLVVPCSIIFNIYLWKQKLDAHRNLEDGLIYIDLRDPRHGVYVCLDSFLYIYLVVLVTGFLYTTLELHVVPNSVHRSEFRAVLTLFIVLWSMNFFTAQDDRFLFAGVSLAVFTEQLQRCWRKDMQLIPTFKRYSKYIFNHYSNMHYWGLYLLTW